MTTLTHSLTTACTPAPVVRIAIINQRTGRVVATASCVKRARRMIDARDNEYGSYVHYMRIV